MPDILEDAFKHHLWANLGILDACAGVGDEVLDASVSGTYGSVRDTLVHMAAAEARYVSHMKGVGDAAQPFAEGGYPGLPALKESLRASGEALIEMASRSGDNPALHGEARGEKYELRISIFFAQAINHATEHRAHVCTILTQQGIEPPVLDVWTWVRSGMPGASAGR